MILLSGIQVRDALKKDLADSLLSLEYLPKLIIIQIGHNNESEIYINQKKKFGESLNFPVESLSCEENISEGELLEIISKYNEDDSVDGIIVQLPIPKYLDRQKILNSISPKKDVDGLGNVQAGLLFAGNSSALIPATAKGIISLIDYYDISLKGKHVCVIGRSNLVGKPIALTCLSRNATVTICHSHTQSLETITKSADILIVASGKPCFINSSYVRLGQIIIDVGIHRIDNKICGDVDFDSVKDIVSAITPVPGGVGPLTVLSLFQNLVSAKKTIL